MILPKHQQAIRAINEKLTLYRENLVQDKETLTEDRKEWLRAAIDNLDNSKLKLVLDQQNTGGHP